VRVRRISYLGPPGTFTHEAARCFFASEKELIPCETVQEVLRQYRDHEVDGSVIAIESSLAGTVAENLDRLRSLEQFLVVGEVLLPTRHQLMARQETELKQIQTIFGHPKAFEECESWLSQHLPKIARKPFPSSAGAAREVSLDLSLKSAAVAPEAAASLYGLVILAPNIEDAPNNVTRFWVLGRETSPPTGNDKTTLYAWNELHPILHGLSASMIDILSIYERPTGEGIDCHSYFIHVKGHRLNPPLAAFLNRFPKVKWIGSYPSGILR